LFKVNAGPGTLNAWTPTNTNTDVPSLSLANNDNQVSDYFFRNNSYFKVRNMQIELLYDKLKKTGFITSCRVYARKRIYLFWFTGYIGQDPERTDVNRIPVPTTFSLGLNINFKVIIMKKYNKIVISCLSILFWHHVADFLDYEPTGVLTSEALQQQEMLMLLLRSLCCNREMNEW
jgi:hypothetical protein